MYGKVELQVVRTLVLDQTESGMLNALVMGAANDGTLTDEERRFARTFLREQEQLDAEASDLYRRAYHEENASTRDQDGEYSIPIPSKNVTRKN